MEVAKSLNEIKEKIIVIKGNCDSVVDTMISNFDFLDNLVLVSGGKTLFLTHGHIYNKDNLPKTNFDAIIYGHFHTGFIERKGDIVIANTGSTSLPKNDTPNSYMVLENKTLTLKDFENKVIKSIEL
jgi:putative phosphoesterase